jgi:predicted GTPase
LVEPPILHLFEAIMKPKKVIIMGAAGRDFHNFNVYFRDNLAYDVVAFTATQIPNIEARRFPPQLAGDLYPNGIPVYPERDLESLISQFHVAEVVFSYSDVPFNHVMKIASMVNACGADFRLLGTRHTMLESSVPVIAVVAARTGSGKSQTSRKVSEVLRNLGKKVVVIRHPMPYGDLNRQKVQRFETMEDLARSDCTVEELEEYELHIARGTVIYAGVDYAAILREAERVADVIVWDGGNNDTPFYRPDLTITVVDPHRPGHELTYYPGNTNLLLADIVVINKEDTAAQENIDTVKANVRAANPSAVLIEAASPVTVDDASLIKGKRVLVVEDGPTLTHGDMQYGAGVIAARKFGARGLVDPHPWAVGSIAETFAKYPRIGALLPAVGYGPSQIKDLQDTINAVDCDVVVVGTPVDLTRIIHVNKPAVRVRYELLELSTPGLSELITNFVTGVRWTDVLTEMTV